MNKFCIKCHTVNLKVSISKFLDSTVTHSGFNKRQWIVCVTATKNFLIYFHCKSFELWTVWMFCGNFIIFFLFNSFIPVNPSIQYSHYRSGQLNNRLWTIVKPIKFAFSKLYYTTHARYSIVSLMSIVVLTVTV